MYYFFFTLLIFSHSVFSSEIQTACEPFVSQIEPEGNSTPSSDIKYKKGVLWQIETPDGKTNYLFGTMHSQDYAVSKYPPQVRLALVRSKVLLMETVPNEEAISLSSTICILKMAGN